MPEAQIGTDPKDFDFKKFGDDFSKKFDEISTGVNKVSKEVLEAKKETKDLKAKLEKKQEPIDDNSNYLFGEEKLAKEVKSLKSEIQSIKKQTEIDGQLNAYKEECVRWDKKASDKFPILNTNQKFSAEVSKIVATKPPIGKDPDGKFLYSPDAVWSAANEVYNEWREKDMIPAPPPDLDVGGYSKKIKGKGMNDIQREISERLGVSEERVKESYEKFNDMGGMAGLRGQVRQFKRKK